MGPVDLERDGLSQAIPAQDMLISSVPMIKPGYSWSQVKYKYQYIEIVKCKLLPSVSFTDLRDTFPTNNMLVS